MLICKHADNAIRWKDGERLDRLFEQRCDQLHASGNARPEAVVTDDAVFTFRELDDRANQVARFLIEQGLKSGDRIGLMFDRTVDSYVALLAVLKINAAYVPLDADFPTERIGFILKDAEVKAIVSLSVFRPKLADFPVRSIFLDAVAREINYKEKVRLADHEKSPVVDQVCYIIYTSGTTGTPKGVAIEHPSICNFVKIAAEVYGIREGDRAYQGMTIAFEEADAENLPFDDNSFDTVVSTFGVMFTPNQDRAAAELMRVCRPKGQIGLANWTPEGFIGQVFKTLGKYLPPPAGTRSPALWGTPARLTEMFDAGARSIQAESRLFNFRYRSPTHFLEVFKTFYGPVLKAFAALEPAKQEELHDDLHALIVRMNRSGDATMVVPSEYLEVVIIKR